MDDEEDFSRYLELINNCDEDDPLLSRTTLGARLGQIPMKCGIPESALNELTMALSVEQLIPTDSGLARDYRGMAELMGFSSAEIEGRLKKSSNSTKLLLDTYVYKQNSGDISVNDLIKFIEQIERFDVIDDFLPTLVKLASRRDSVANQQQLQLPDRDRLTFDDTPESAIIYDACICYAPQDTQAAQDLKEELQNRGVRVATAADLLPGNFEHDALMRLIDLRCRKAIIIVTRNFCNSDECKYQLEVAIKSNKVKIIPVVYEKIPREQMPGMIAYTAKINFIDSFSSRSVELNRLIRSLECSPQGTSSNSNTNINTNASSNNHRAENSHPLIQPNRRTSSFNGRIAAESASYLLSREHSSFSNGNSPASSRSAITATATNDPVVELSHSQDSSSAIRDPIHGHSRVANDTFQHHHHHHTDESSASSSKKLLAKIWNTLSSSSRKRSDFEPSLNSQTRLLSAESGDLTAANSTDLGASSSKYSSEPTERSDCV